MKLLIVDDYLTNRQLLRLTLEAEGFQIWEASDGVESLAILERQKIDAVIADILMPNMDGYRLCQELRQRDKLYALPVLLYTGTYTAEEDRELGLNMGADAYLAKPASKEALLAALNEAIQKAKGRTTAASAGNGDPSHVMRQYNQTLIRKLEKKNLQLEEALVALTRAYEMSTL
jgi:two-component system response regulator ResD